MTAFIGKDVELVRGRAAASWVGWAAEGQGWPPRREAYASDVHTQTHTYAYIHIHTRHEHAQLIPF